MKIKNLFNESLRLLKHNINYFKSRENIDISDQKVKNITKELQKKGYYVINNFFTNDECENLKNEIDRLISENKKSKFYKDSNDYRIYGSNFHSKKINNFNTDHFLNSISDYFLKKKSSAFFTLANRIEYKDTALGSGGGWHRDISLPSQFKTMLYLSDVDENGPFEYVSGTQKWYSLFFGILFCKVSSGANRISNESVDLFLKSKAYSRVTFKASRGTLIIFDSYGIHRGSPLKRGIRYALTNYFFPDKFIQQNKDYFTEKFQL